MYFLIELIQILCYIMYYRYVIIRQSKYFIISNRVVVYCIIKARTRSSLYAIYLLTQLVGPGAARGLKSNNINIDIKMTITTFFCAENIIVLIYNAPVHRNLNIWNENETQWKRAVVLGFELLLSIIIQYVLQSATANIFQVNYMAVC